MEGLGEVPGREFLVNARPAEPPVPSRPVEATMTAGYH